MFVKLILVFFCFQNSFSEPIEPEIIPEEDDRGFYTDQPWAPINALPPGGPKRNCSACSCNCDCSSPISNPWISAPPTCPPCPTAIPSPPSSNMTFPPNGTSGATCKQNIENAVNLYGNNIGKILGAIVGYLLSNLVKILILVLAGNNTLEGSVLPLLEIVCYLLGLVLILLQSIGILGVLGPNGLLDNILDALTG